MGLAPIVTDRQTDRQTDVDLYYIDIIISFYLSCIRLLPIKITSFLRYPLSTEKITLKCKLIGGGLLGVSKV